jgi:hypothetical protein
VEPEIAILALQVTLEKEELGLYAIHQRAKIDKPPKDFYGFFRDFMAPLVIDASHIPVAPELEAEKKKNHRLLSEALARWEKKFEDASSIPFEKRLLIRLSQENLEKTLEDSEHIVTSFFKDHLASWMEGQKTAAC